MTENQIRTYTDFSCVKRIVEVGGRTKQELIQQLHASNIRLNEFGDKLLHDEKFLISETKYCIETVEVTVHSLGFHKGTNTAELYKRANEIGLRLCSMELGPFLRLAYTDQAEHTSHVQNQAPSSAVTIASAPLYKNDDFPKGFYLRRMDGELWLRGYTADVLHVWNPQDVFIFCVKG